MTRQRLGGVGLVGLMAVGLWLLWSVGDTGVEALSDDDVARNEPPSSGRRGADGDTDRPSGSNRGSTSSDGSPSSADDGGSLPLALGGATERTDEELAALAEELENDPNTQVTCDLGIDVREGVAYLAIGGHSGFNGRRVQVVNGVAYMPLVYDLGELGDQTFDERSGVFSLEGYGPVDIAWSDRPEDGHGHCTSAIEPEPGRASFTGTLTLAESGAPAVGGWVEGCGNMAFADQHGIVHMDIVPEPCTVLAMRQDGLLRTVSDPVQVSPSPGEDVVVDIQIPEAARGGLGVQLSMNPEGHVQIDGLLGTGPAGEAGLQEGDLIVAVDGESLDGLEMGDVVKAIGGAAGTDVSLTVDRGGEQLQFDITREALTPG